MKTAEKLTDEANKKICSGEILQNLKPAAGKEFSDLPWEESEDMKEICDNFRIIERQRDQGAYFYARHVNGEYYDRPVCEKLWTDSCRCGRLRWSMRTIQSL